MWRPIELYRVIRSSGVRGRLDSASRGLAPFVGREDEIRLQLNRWELAREGEGQTVLVIGEAGIGKSRLIREFHQRIAGTPHTLIECAGDPLLAITPPPSTYSYRRESTLGLRLWHSYVDRQAFFIAVSTGKVMKELWAHERLAESA